MDKLKVVVIGEDGKIIRHPRLVFSYEYNSGYGELTREDITYEEVMQIVKKGGARLLSEEKLEEIVELFIREEILDKYL